MPLGHLNLITCNDFDNPVELWKYYGKVEKFIDEFADCYESAHLTEGFKIELNVTARDASLSPPVIMDRTKLDWTPKFLMEGRHLKAAWARSIQAYLDWISFIPELEQLNEHDKVSIL